MRKRIIKSESVILKELKKNNFPFDPTSATNWYPYIVTAMVNQNSNASTRSDQLLKPVLKQINYRARNDNRILLDRFIRKALVQISNTSVVIKYKSGGNVRYKVTDSNHPRVIKIMRQTPPNWEGEIKTNSTDNNEVPELELDLFDLPQNNLATGLIEIDHSTDIKVRENEDSDSETHDEKEGNLLPDEESSLSRLLGQSNQGEDPAIKTEHIDEAYSLERICEETPQIVWVKENDFVVKGIDALNEHEVTIRMTTDYRVRCQVLVNEAEAKAIISWNCTNWPGIVVSLDPSNQYQAQRIFEGPNQGLEFGKFIQNIEDIVSSVN